MTTTRSRTPIQTWYQVSTLMDALTLAGFTEVSPSKEGLPVDWKISAVTPNGQAVVFLFEETVAKAIEFETRTR